MRDAFVIGEKFYRRLLKQIDAEFNRNNSTHTKLKFIHPVYHAICYILNVVRIFFGILFFCSLYLVCCTDTFSFIFDEEDARSHPERMYYVIQKMVIRSNECYFDFMKKQYTDRAISVMEDGARCADPTAMFKRSLRSV